MSDHHVHQHVVQLVASGKSVDEAIANGVAGLTDPQGHHAKLAFDSFEVLKITGTIRSQAGTIPAALAMLEFCCKRLDRTNNEEF